MILSVIIPTLNEEDNISQLIPYLKENSKAGEIEIIVVDAGSSDLTVDKAQELGAKVIIYSQAGRAVQMNLGAKKAQAAVYYFLHADSRPPQTFVKDILCYVTKQYPIGCYRFRFDSNSLLLRINAYFTRFPFLWCRGGDQSLFITKLVFEKLKGFDEKLSIMEDFDLVHRALKKYDFMIIPKDICVSARKYHDNSYLKVNLINLYVFVLFRLGVKPTYLKRIYKKYIK